jgi:manganese transport protein
MRQAEKRIHVSRVPVDHLGGGRQVEGVAEDPHFLVMGAHGHKGLKDIVFGTTVDKVRHRVNIPVFIVK